MPVPDIEHDNKHTQSERQVLTGNSHVDAALKPCRYRGPANGEMFSCDNTTDLIHAGFVTSQFCKICPYAAPPAVGFFAQTEQLLIQKARRGEITVAAKPCGGCNETKHRAPDSPVMQFVWPYWAGGAQGDELRWSIRSVETFFQGRAKITIIGDRPEWYHGHVIRKKRVPQSKTNQAFRDMLSKVFFIASHAEVDAECVWMMDDIYFLKPFTLNDIKTPRAEPWRPSTGNSWQKRKTLSMDTLAARGLTQHDYATHMPHWLEKDKLRAMFDDFNLHEHTMLWEVLYGNLYRESPQRTRPFFARFQHKASKETFQRLTAVPTVMNHTESAWCDGLREFLAELLPTPASVEGEQAEAKPTYIVRKKAARVVKRRPLETHRAYIEAMAAAKADQPAAIDVPHIMIIQAAYTDADLSASRLAIARHTSIPSLAFQSTRPVVHIAVNPADPHLAERLEAYRSTGCEIVPLYRSEWKLYKENWELPDGRKIVSRMDDDDVISRDYCRELRAAAPTSGEWNLMFPVGYVWWRNTAYRLEHPGTQFVTLVTDQQTDPHQEGHWKYHQQWQTKIVSSLPSWIWVRHGAASTSTLEKYRTKKLKGIDANRIPINLRAIQRAIEPTGLASGRYHEHQNQSVLREVLKQNHIHAGTRIPAGLEVIES
jgi:hypothetical protein